MTGPLSSIDVSNDRTAQDSESAPAPWPGAAGLGRYARDGKHLCTRVWDVAAPSSQQQPARLRGGKLDTAAGGQCPPISLTPHSASSSSSRLQHDRLVRSEPSPFACHLRSLRRMCVVRSSRPSFQYHLGGYCPRCQSPAPALFSNAVPSSSFISTSSLPLSAHLPRCPLTSPEPASFGPCPGSVRPKTPMSVCLVPCVLTE
ncbi:hypothetical protein C8Q77DRAFT_38468 [Trametes polyzona]|nr:hypothetical protein C8Q77DRAFT_38468 [Trametes polyzona]